MGREKVMGGEIRWRSGGGKDEKNARARELRARGMG